MPDPVRAKDVQIIHQYTAVCHRPGCTWQSKPKRTWADASLDRDRHLGHHREEEARG